MARPDDHRFRVSARDVDHHPARVVEESCFEAAALAYLEDFAGGDGGGVSLIVRDLDSGREHCFTVDLATGETAPCD